MTETAPRPWVVLNQTDIFVDERSGQQIGDTWIRAAGDGYVIELAEARANAELIVRAVNAHGDLVKALWAAEPWLEAEKHMPPCVCDACETYEMIVAALDKTKTSC